MRQERVRNRSPSPTNLMGSVFLDVKEAVLYTCQGSSEMMNNTNSNNCNSSSSQGVGAEDLLNTSTTRPFQDYNKSHVRHIDYRTDDDDDCNSIASNGYCGKENKAIAAANTGIEILEDLSALQGKQRQHFDTTSPSASYDDSSASSEESDVSLCRSNSQYRNFLRHVVSKPLPSSHTNRTNGIGKKDTFDYEFQNADGDCAASSFANLVLGQGGPCSLSMEDEGIEVINHQRQQQRLLGRVEYGESSGQYNPLSDMEMNAKLNLALEGDRSDTPNRSLVVKSSRTETRGAVILNTADITKTNGRLQPRHSPLKKSCLKQDTSIAATISTVSSTGTNHSSLPSVSGDGSMDEGTVGNTKPSRASTDNANAPSKQQQKERCSVVTFERIDIREYNVALSENPSCSEGPPIELGWKFHDKQSVLVEDFEEIRRSQRRRRLPELLLSERERRRLLVEQGGYTQHQLKENVRVVEQLKRQRVLTYLFLPAMALDEAAEDMVQYVTQMFGQTSTNEIWVPPTTPSKKKG